MPIPETDRLIKSIEPVPPTVYYGTFVDTPRLGELRITINAVVGVNRDGIIDFISEAAEKTPEQIIEFAASKWNISSQEIVFKSTTNNKAGFFAPGFIDTHIHASQYPNIGIGFNVPLLDWLNKHTYPLENKFTDSNVKNKLPFAQDVYSKVIAKTLSSGTTCASYFTTTDSDTTNLFADLLLEQGQRGFVGKVCMDHNETYPQYQESLEECERSMDAIIDHLDRINPPNEDLVKPIVTPRFALNCSTDQLGFLGKLSAARKLPIQTHISENNKEIELVLATFPDCENYAEVYDKYKLLTEFTILAHAVHLTEEDCSIISKRGCSLSHCPTSNSFLGSGAAPIHKYLIDDKINVSLGTDVSGGFEASILAMIKHAILVSQHLAMQSGSDNEKLSLADGLYMATEAGARAVGLENKIGSFQLGKSFDAQFIDLASPSSNLDIFSWQLPEDSENSATKKAKILNLVGKWVFSGDDRNCVRVWCNGRLVVDKYPGKSK